MTRSAAHQPVTDRLRQEILSGDFPPGTRLVELRLTRRYGVGRAGIRSAIVELAKEGLVTREANRGATVRGLSLAEAIEVYEARAAIEGLMARHAARQASPAEREHLRSFITAMREAVESSSTTRFVELGRELHDQISKSGRHRVARDLIETLRNQSRHHPSHLPADRGRTQRSLAEHIAIIDAIVEGDAEGAERAARVHIDSIISELR